MPARAFALAPQLLARRSAAASGSTRTAARLAQCCARGAQAAHQRRRTRRRELARRARTQLTRHDRRARASRCRRRRQTWSARCVAAGLARRARCAAMTDKPPPAHPFTAAPGGHVGEAAGCAGCRCVAPAAPGQPLRERLCARAVRAACVRRQEDLQPRASTLRSRCWRRRGKAPGGSSCPPAGSICRDESALARHSLRSPGRVPPRYDTPHEGAWTVSSEPSSLA